VAAVVLGLWFPFPYRSLAGGQHLFWILIGVDVVCGPLLTAIIFNPKKSRRELLFDLTLVFVIQLMALAYGLHSISEARPVVLAFEVDRLTVVSAVQVDKKAMSASQALSWGGPVLVGTRDPKSGDEVLESVEMSIQGIEISARPDWWQPYDASKPQIRRRMKSLSILRAGKNMQTQADIDAAAKKTRLKIDQLYYLPLVSQKSLDQWIALLDAQANIVGYASVGGFD